MTQRCASQETVPAPVGDRRAPPPRAPAWELILQLCINSQLLLWSSLHTSKPKRACSWLVQILSLRKELLLLFPQDGLGPFHMHSLKGLEHLWEFSSENHCLQRYSLLKQTHTPTPRPATPRDQWDLKYALNRHSRGTPGAPSLLLRMESSAFAEPAASPAGLATLATCTCHAQVFTKTAAKTPVQVHLWRKSGTCKCAPMDETLVLGGGVPVAWGGWDR